MTHHHIPVTVTAVAAPLHPSSTRQDQRQCPIGQVLPCVKEEEEEEVDVDVEGLRREQATAARGVATGAAVVVGGGTRGLDQSPEVVVGGGAYPPPVAVTGPSGSELDISLSSTADLNGDDLGFMDRLLPIDSAMFDHLSPTLQNEDFSFSMDTSTEGIHDLFDL